MTKILSLIFIIPLMFIGSFSYVFSQQVSAKIELSPESPEPKSLVTLTFSSYSFDTNSAFITWKVDGVTKLSGVGENKLILNTGNVGQSQTVTLTAENQVGYFVEQRIVVTPASVILMYEAPKSHVPLFYEGKSFAATAGLIRVTALPSVGDERGVFDPSSLSYTWYVNDEPMKNASGRGKQSIETKLDFLRTKNDIKVVVRTPSGESVSKTISVSPRNIDPKLYEYDELFGTKLTSPINKRLETSKTASLKLEPYFLSYQDDKPSSYRWLLDGFNITPQDGQVVALVPKENSYGVKQLTVSVFGPDKRLQSAETSLEIIFDSRE